MNILIIGLGSMGRRRIRLLRKLNSDINIIGVDTKQERHSEAMEVGASLAFQSLEEATKAINIDAAFVCTSPLSHKNIIMQLLAKNIHTFTELNLVTDGYEDIINRENQDTVVFLSSTLLYRKDIEYIEQRTKKEIVNYSYHSGQYLPDWHTWENYTDFFVGDKRTNGCREILAIDLPWILSCFGPIKDIHVVKSKMTSLKIDYNDNYMISIQHENGSKGCVFVDVVARKATRKLEVFSEDLHIFWEGTPQSLYEYDIQNKEMKQIETYNEIEKNRDYCDNIIENAYLDEIKVFLDAVSNKTYNFKYDFARDLKTLELIDKIEEV